MSRECGPPDLSSQPLVTALGNDKAFVTEASSDPPALAVFLFNLQQSRSFLLGYLKPDPLLLFLVSVDGIDSSPSLFCSK
jgi:hypothetical protein